MVIKPPISKWAKTWDRWCSLLYFVSFSAYCLFKRAKLISSVFEYIGRSNDLMREANFIHQLSYKLDWFFVGTYSKIPWRLRFSFCFTGCSSVLDSSSCSAASTAERTINFYKVTMETLIVWKSTPDKSVFFSQKLIMIAVLKLQLSAIAKWRIFELGISAATRSVVWSPSSWRHGLKK